MSLFSLNYLDELRWDLCSLAFSSCVLQGGDTDDEQNNSRGALSGFCTMHSKIFLPDSVFSRYRSFPRLGPKAAGHDLVSTILYTEVPKACIQAMRECTEHACLRGAQRPTPEISKHEYAYAL